MLAREHSGARCPYCTEKLWYDLKEEVGGWKIQYRCLQPGGCGREFSPGRISFEEVKSQDEAYQRAEQVGKVLY